MTASRLQREFYRNGPDHRGGDDVSFRDIVQQFEFYQIKIGRWVTPDEQQRAANLFYDALSDLQEILKVPSQVISLNGSLALTFGSGGNQGSCAHYQPRGRILALAKNAGGGSLAHEWFHAFDHYIADKFLLKPPGDGVFASRGWLLQDSYKDHPLNQIVHEVFRVLFLDHAGTGVSSWMRHCQTYDHVNAQLYFSLPEEMAARAFEKVIQTQARKNHFLVSGCLQSPMAKAGLYPNQQLNQKLQRLWLNYFASLGLALEHKVG
ncbi:CLCA_X family protein [Aliidiomarina indica]|uniref:CLCA_X family protein n=1 Tax=Aliidiomarina indica TaxID=2749147 RepID=UPI0038B3C885